MKETRLGKTCPNVIDGYNYLQNLNSGDLLSILATTGDLYTHGQTGGIGSPSPGYLGAQASVQFLRFFCLKKAETFSLFLLLSYDQGLPVP